MPIQLNDGIMRSFYPRYSYANNNSHPDIRVTSIKFSSDGKKLVAVCNDQHVRLYNCDEGTVERTIAVRKYGGVLADFMDTNDCVLITSSKRDAAVRELNLQKQSYQTIYAGHTAPVVSLAVHPAKRIFLTGSEDKSIALWDFRTQKPESFQNKFADTPLVAFETSGNLFVAAISGAIQIFDLRGLGYGPFSEFPFNRNDAKWTNIKLSKKGDQILLSSSSSKIRLIDGLMGRIQREFESKQACHHRLFDLFTPDFQFK